MLNNLDTFLTVFLGGQFTTYLTTFLERMFCLLGSILGPKLCGENKSETALKSLDLVKLLH